MNWRFCHLACDSVWWSRSLPNFLAVSRLGVRDSWAVTQDSKEYAAFSFWVEIVHICGRSGGASCLHFHDRRMIYFDRLFGEASIFWLEVVHICLRSWGRCCLHLQGRRMIDLYRRFRETSSLCPHRLSPAFRKNVLSPSSGKYNGKSLLTFVRITSNITPD